jgi:hypothetical protein
MFLKPKISNILIAVLMLVSFYSVSGNGLSVFEIKGMVLDQETDAPIPLAEVFISGTTFGSITDGKGEFELQTNYLPCLLVVSHISYVPFSKMIDDGSMSYVKIALIPYEHEIKEISVEGMNMRKENLKLFRQAFFGMDEYASACNILNDSVLRFRWDSSIFSASAYQPLLVDNNKLGYRMKIILNDCRLVYDPVTYKKIQKNKKNKSIISGAVYQMQGEFFFIQHPPGKKGKQERTAKFRLEAYFGSRMHFLRALYSGDLKRQGYRINPDISQVPITSYGNADSWPGIKFIFLDPEGYPVKLMICPEKPMSIEFVKDFSGKPVNLERDNGTDLIHLHSKLAFGSKKCVIRYNGTTYDYSLIFSGYIGRQRLATLLPDDFVPEE